MGNFITQASSDFWDILRKKIPESFGMQWGVPDSIKQASMETASTGAPAAPLVAAGTALARKAINAYADLPTFSNEDISKGVQARVAMSGFGPKPRDLTSSGGGGAPGPEINPVAATSAPSPAVNRPLTPDAIYTSVSQKNPAREAINNVSVDRSEPFTPAPVTYTSRGVDTVGGNGGGGEKTFPGYTPSAFTQEALNNLNALEAKGDWRDTRNWHGELTAARNLIAQAMSADVGMTGQQQNYDIANRKVPGEIAHMAADTARLNLDKQLPFSGEEVGYWDPVTGARTVLTKGKSLYGDSDSLKNRTVQQDLAMKEIEEIDKNLMTNVLLRPEEKKALQDRKVSLTQGLIASSDAKKQGVAKMSERDFRDQMTAKGIPLSQHQQWIDQYRKAGRIF